MPVSYSQVYFYVLTVDILESCQWKRQCSRTNVCVFRSSFPLKVFLPSKCWIYPFIQQIFIEDLKCASHRHVLKTQWYFHTVPRASLAFGVGYFHWTVAIMFKLLARASEKAEGAYTDSELFSDCLPVYLISLDLGQFSPLWLYQLLPSPKGTASKSQHHSNNTHYN